MADNVAITAGAGTTVATDDVAGVHYQRVKLVDGTLDSTAAIAGDATNGLDVDVTRVSGTVTVDGSGVTQPVSAASLPLPTGASTAAKQPALGTAGTASADVITVQGIASMTALTVDGSGVTQPVSGTVTANAGSGPFPVSDNSGSLTVDAPAGTPVFTRSSDGTNSETNLYDVDSGVGSEFVRGVSLRKAASGASVEYGTATDPLRVDPTGTTTQPVSGTVTANAGTGPFPVSDNAGSLTIDNSTLAVVGGGTEATAMRVTLASDSTGVVSVDDNGGSITVDTAGGALDVSGATVTVQGTGTFAVQDSQKIADNGAFVDGTTPVQPAGYIFDEVAGTALTENDIGSARMDSKRAVVSVIEDITTRGRRATVTASNALKVDNSAVTQPVSGTVTANQGTAGTAWEVIGDVAQDVAAATNPVGAGGSHETMADSAPANRVGTDGDANRLSTTDGALFTIPCGPQTWSYHSNGSTALTDASVHAAPSAGLSLYVTDIVFSSGAATAINIFFEEGASTVLGPWYLEAIAGRGMAVHFGTPKKITAATALTVTTSASIAHSVDVTGFIAPG